MDMFNVKRRDNPSMDRWTDLKSKSFGGPAEKSDFDKSKRMTLAGYQRVVDRNSDFEGGNGKFRHNYDPTWKAVTRDRISRDAKKKPFEPMYAKPTVATVDAIEEGRIFRFEQFVNENFDAYESEAMMDDEPMDNMEEPMMGAEAGEMEPQVDEEKLESLMEEFGDDLGDMIESIMEKMEIEDKAEVCDLLCAAVKKMCSEEEEESSEEGEE
jgi:hypothetical protein